MGSTKERTFATIGLRIIQVTRAAVGALERLI
jgi:hypothetical protein